MPFWYARGMMHWRRWRCARCRPGKHVLVEKPAARSVAELAPLLEEERASGVRVRVGYNHRFHPALLKARQIIDAGELGPLLVVRGRYGHGGRLGYETEWRAQAEISGGGELIDQGVHLIDLARWFLGDFAEIRGTVADAFLEHAGGGQRVSRTDHRCRAGRVAACELQRMEESLLARDLWARGKLQLNGLGGSYGPERLVHYRMTPAMGPPESETYDFPGADLSWRREMEAFERDIATGTTPSPGPPRTRSAVLENRGRNLQPCASPGLNLIGKTGTPS